MKKILTLLLAACLVFGCSASAFSVCAAENEPLPFTDIKSGAWYCDYVDYVYKNSLMNGTTDTSFSPDATMTRAMLVTVLYRYEGTPAVADATPFTDVKSGTWYTDAVNWAYSNSIVNGTSATTFSPESKITREQIVAIFYRYADAKGYDVSNCDSLSSYTDADNVSGYAKAPFGWSVANGIVNGTDDTTLSPGDNATRAQCAAIMYRFIKWTEGQEKPEPEPEPEPEPKPDNIPHLSIAEGAYVKYRKENGHGGLGIWPIEGVAIEDVQNAYIVGENGQPDFVTPWTTTFKTGIAIRGKWTSDIENYTCRNMHMMDSRIAEYTVRYVSRCWCGHGCWRETPEESIAVLQKHIDEGKYSVCGFQWQGDPGDILIGPSTFTCIACGETVTPKPSYMTELSGNVYVCTVVN